MSYTLSTLSKGENNSPFNNCLLYVPETIDENTTILVYEHGSGGSVESAREYAQTVQPNQIIIAPSRTSDNTTHYNQVMEMVEQLRKEYNITNYNLDSSGFSAGGYSGLAVASLNIEAHKEELGPQIVYMVDDYSNSYSSPKTTYNNLHLDNLKDNNSIMFALEAPVKYGEAKYRAQAAANYYAEQGINVVRVECKYDYNHNTVKRLFFEKGFANFSQGNTTLPNDDYFVYRVYNKDTKSWEVIDVNEIDSLDKIYNYFGIDSSEASNNIYKGNLKYLRELLSNRAINVSDVNSDLGILTSNINNVFSAISSSSFIATDAMPVSSSGSSTTSVPSKIPEIVASYYKNIANLLCNLSISLEKFEQGGLELDATEKEIGNMATNLNNNIPINEMPLLDQTDYKNIKYSTGTVATSGCGLTSVCMVASYFTGKLYTPEDLAEVADEAKGSNVDKMTRAADYVGLNWYCNEKTNPNKLKEMLQEGKVVICLVKNSSHFVVCKGITEDGKILVNDPYGPWAKDEPYSLEELKMSSGKTWVFDPAENQNLRGGTNISNPTLVAETPITSEPTPVVETPPVSKPTPVVETPPVSKPTPVVEAPPVSKPTPVVETPPVSKPTPVVETPPVSKPTPVVETPPVIEPTPVVETPPVIEPTPVVETPPVIEPTPVVETPTVPEPTPIVGTPITEEKDNLGKYVIPGIVGATVAGAAATYGVIKNKEKKKNNVEEDEEDLYSEDI